MYGEYAERIFGFCLVTLRDREEAADAMHDTFVLAAQRVYQLRDPDRLSAWLFAVARHVCFRRLGQRQRVTPMEALPEEIVLDDDPGASLSAAEASALVWEAAGGLNERDRAVLALNVQQGLEGAELGAALGVQHANPYSLLHRAKEQLERAVSVLLVARAGRRDCPDLAQLLDDWDGALTPLLRKRLGRHIDDCAACARTKTRTRPLAAMAGLPLLKPVRARALVAIGARNISADTLLQRAAGEPLLTERWQRDGFPPPLAPERKRRRKLLVVVAAAALGAGLAVTLGLGAASGQGTKPQPAPHLTALSPRSQRRARARVRTLTTTRTLLTTTTSAPTAPASTPTTVPSVITQTQIVSPTTTAPRQAAAVVTPPATQRPTPKPVPSPTTAKPPPTTVPKAPPTTVHAPTTTAVPGT
jgi:RNA polymerase sigma factor (sigma-70 family)